MVYWGDMEVGWGHPHEGLHAPLALDLNASHCLPLIKLPKKFPARLRYVNLT